MTIAVLYYPTNEVYMISTDYKIIENDYDGSIERYLTEHCEFDLSDISYMVGEGIIINTCSHGTFNQ